MIDSYRAAWFNTHARFDGCGVSDFREIWESWSSFVGSDAGSKPQMLTWLLKIGIKRHPLHSRLLVGMKIK